MINPDNYTVFVRSVKNTHETFRINIIKQSINQNDNM